MLGTNVTFLSVAECAVKIAILFSYSYCAFSFVFCSSLDTGKVMESARV